MIISVVRAAADDAAQSIEMVVLLSSCDHLAVTGLQSDPFFNAYNSDKEIVRG